MEALFTSRPERQARGQQPPRAHGLLFTEDFDLPRRDGLPEPETVSPAYSAADIAEARAEAWATGRAAGSAEADTATAAKTGALLERIAAALHDAKEQSAAIAERSAEAIARLLLESLASLLPALCERHGEAELCALIRTVLPALAQEPAITVRVNPAHTPALMRELDRLDPDLVERVRLVPVEAIAVGNVRVNWRDGSALRDTASLWQQVRDVLEPAGLLGPGDMPARDAATAILPAPMAATMPATMPATPPATMPAPIAATMPAIMKETEYAD